MRVFLAFPFSSIVNTETGRIDEKEFNYLSTIRNDIIANNYEVFLAHYREEWGKKLMTPDVCTPLDFAEMEKTDLVLAFPGEPASGGVHIEIGWASAMKKKVVLFLKKGFDYSPLILGLGKVTDSKIVYYEKYEELDIIGIIKENS